MGNTIGLEDVEPSKPRSYYTSVEVHTRRPDALGSGSSDVVIHISDAHRVTFRMRYSRTTKKTMNYVVTGDLEYDHPVVPVVVWYSSVVVDEGRKLAICSGKGQPDMEVPLNETLLAAIKSAGFPVHNPDDVNSAPRKPRDAAAVAADMAEEGGVGGFTRLWRMPAVMPESLDSGRATRVALATIAATTTTPAAE